MFNISSKLYKSIWWSYAFLIFYGGIFHVDFIPSAGYLTLSKWLIWLFAIWFAIVSSPHMNAYARKKNRMEIPFIFNVIIFTCVFAYVNALIIFETVPTLTAHLPTSSKEIYTTVRNKKIKPTRAFLACAQSFTVKDSMFYGKLCVTKEFFYKKEIGDSISISSEVNLFGSYLISYK